MVDLGVGFAVEVKRDCPHVAEAGIRDISPDKARELVARRCEECGHEGEVWFNLSTHQVLCSRYAKSHMLRRAQELRAANEKKYGADPGAAAGDSEVAGEGRHAGQIAVSALDLSVWCFECDSYIESDYTQPSVNALCEAKFGGSEGGPGDATDEDSQIHPHNVLVQAARQAGIIPATSSLEGSGPADGEVVVSAVAGEAGAGAGADPDPSGSGDGTASAAVPAASGTGAAPRSPPPSVPPAPLPADVLAARARDIAVAHCNGAMQQLSSAMHVSPGGCLETHGMDLPGIAKAVRAGDIKSVTLLTGAGVSVSAGIPDFRSKGGLYEQLRKEGLPGGMTAPEDLFSIRFFTRHSPRPFYERAKTMLFSSASPRPTVCHYFQRLLMDKGLIKRIYTQNIDSLEHKAGIPRKGDVLMQCHGGMSGAHCTGCKREVDLDELERRFLETDKLPRCKECGATPKPDIVFFGEGLPDAFHECVKRDFVRARRTFVYKSKEAQEKLLEAILPVVTEAVRTGVTSDPRLRELATKARTVPVDEYSWRACLADVRDDSESCGEQCDLVRLLTGKDTGGAEPEPAPRSPEAVRAALAGGPFDLRELRREAGGSDLFIVMGTSLKVAPVCSLPEMVLPGTSRALFNLDKVGDFREGKDAVVLGSCDESCRALARELGWEEELDALLKAGNKALDEASTPVKGKKPGAGADPGGAGAGAAGASSGGEGASKASVRSSLEGEEYFLI